MWKRLVMAAGAAALVLAAIVVARTLGAESAGEPVEPVAGIPLEPAAAAARLAGALRFETVSYENPERIDPQPFRSLHQYLSEVFPLTHSTLERETVAELSLLYRWRGRDSGLRPVVFMAHQDVVPVEEESADSWSFEPFAGEVAGGYVLGRGALDDKSGLVGLLEAVEILLESGFEPERTIYLAFGHDEEIGGWQGAGRIADLLASRGIRPLFALDEGGMITQGIMPGLKAPAALVGIAEKGSANIELRVRVPGGHSSVQQKSTAIGILSRALSRIEDHPPEARLEAPTRQMLRRIAPRLPLLQRMAGANLWLFEPLVIATMAGGPSGATVRSTIAPTMIRAGVKPNVLPTQATAVVNVRILTGDSVRGLVEHFRRVVDDGRVEIELLGRFTDPSPVSSVDTPAFRLIERSILEAAELEDLVVAPFLMIGGTDAKHFVEVADEVYRFLGARITSDNLTRVHGIDERISVEDYERVVRIFHQLLRNTGSLGEH